MCLKGPKDRAAKGGRRKREGKSFLGASCGRFGLLCPSLTEAEPLSYEQGASEKSVIGQEPLDPEISNKPVPDNAIP